MKLSGNTKEKLSFIHIMKRWTISSLIILAIFLLSIHVIKNTREIKSRTEQMRIEYKEEQKKLIKSEVNQVVRVIDYETNKYFRHAKDNVRQRVLEAYSIAENIYSQYRGKKTEDEIKQIIIDALRPIRFDNGQGYYFINGYDGVPSLLADRPDQEGKSLLDSRDTRGQYVFRDLIALVKSKGEGFYSYHWTKPDREGDDFEKTSYVKLFEPFDWFIGTGIYLDDIEKEMQRIIAHYVTNHRDIKDSTVTVNSSSSAIKDLSNNITSSSRDTVEKS